MNWELFETLNSFNLINNKGVQVKHFTDFMEMVTYLDDNDINITDANMNGDVFLAQEVTKMKALTLTLALTLPIIWGLDLTFCNIMIAVAIWAVEVIKWMNDKEL